MTEKSHQELGYPESASSLWPEGGTLLPDRILDLEPAMLFIELEEFYPGRVKSGSTLPYSMSLEPGYFCKYFSFILRYLSVFPTCLYEQYVGAQYLQRSEEGVSWSEDPLELKL